MKTPIVLAAILAVVWASCAQVILRPGESGTIFTAPVTSSTPGFGSLGWTRDPIKDVSWTQPTSPTAFAYIIRDTTGIVVTPLDDFVVPFGAGTMWQEGSDLPELVWLRVVLSNDPLAPGDTVRSYALRSGRFGFDRPGAGPFEVPEPKHIAVLVAVGLLGFAAYRKFW
jgi:hypothetical protein